MSALPMYGCLTTSINASRTVYVSEQPYELDFAEGLRVKGSAVKQYTSELPSPLLPSLEPPKSLTVLAGITRREAGKQGLSCLA